MSHDEVIAGHLDGIVVHDACFVDDESLVESKDWLIVTNDPPVTSHDGLTKVDAETFVSNDP